MRIKRYLNGIIREGENQMETMAEIKWYNAKNLRPVTGSDVVVMTEFPHNHKLGTVFTVKYDEGYFNGKENEIKGVVCWAYKSDFEATFDGFKEEDDF